MLLRALCCDHARSYLCSYGGQLSRFVLPGAVHVEIELLINVLSHQLS